eukprot:553316-Amorphochlora_amoeboformis.AAC.2
MNMIYQIGRRFLRLRNPRPPTADAPRPSPQPKPRDVEAFSTYSLRLLPRVPLPSIYEQHMQPNQESHVEISLNITGNAFAAYNPNRDYDKLMDDIETNPKAHTYEGEGKLGEMTLYELQDFAETVEDE